MIPDMISCRHGRLTIAKSAWQGFRSHAHQLKHQTSRWDSQHEDDDAVLALGAVVLLQQFRQPPVPLPWVDHLHCLQPCHSTGEILVRDREKNETGAGDVIRS